MGLAKRYSSDSKRRNMPRLDEAIAPWGLNPYEHSGFLVSTVLKRSEVSGGGLGRFAVSGVKKGTILRKTRMITNERPSKGTTLVSTSLEALLQSLDFPDLHEQPCNAEQIVNFAGTPSNVESDNGATFHWTPCNYFNHANGARANVILTIDSEFAYALATRDIVAGEELYQDYKIFKLPKWFREWAADNSYTDTQALGEKLKGL